LLTYPFVFEPLWGLRTQSNLWTAAFLGFVALYAAGAMAVWRVGSVSAPAVDAEEPAPAAGRVALWLALPAFASWMLLATTQQLGQDLAAVPFLWVLPLAAYLVSFILSFDHRCGYKPGLYA